MNWPESRFWKYSLEVYARPEVRSTCLKLQDEAGADVNILLLCLWLASLKKPPLTPEILSRVDLEAAPWRDSVILPLRQARRGVGAFLPLPEAAVMKKQIQQVEIDAEHSAQLRLEHFADGLSGDELTKLSATEVAAVSIGNYLKMIAPGQEELCAKSADHLVESAL